MRVHIPVRPNADLHLQSSFRFQAHREASRNSDCSVVRFGGGSDMQWKGKGGKWPCPGGLTVIMSRSNVCKDQRMARPWTRRMLSSGGTCSCAHFTE